MFPGQRLSGYVMKTFIALPMLTQNGLVPTEISTRPSDRRSANYLTFNVNVPSNKSMTYFMLRGSMYTSPPGAVQVTKQPSALIYASRWSPARLLIVSQQDVPGGIIPPTSRLNAYATSSHAHELSQIPMELLVAQGCATLQLGSPFCYSCAASLQSV